MAALLMIPSMKTSMPYGKGIGMLARGSLAQGLLVDKPARDYLGHAAEQVMHAWQSVRSCSTEVRRPARVALGYVLGHPAVTAAVVGARTLGQLEDMTGIFDAAALNEKEMDCLRQSIPANIYTDHR
jgi:aryl-alcohol dehydrogenase-like predicted oxidoreductase